MKIFAEIDLREFLEAQVQHAVREVGSGQPNRLLGMNETQYIEYLGAQARVDPLRLHLAGCSISDREEMIPAERFPGGGFRYAR